MFLPQPNHKQIFLTPDITIYIFTYFPKSLFRLVGMVGKACLSGNAYFTWTPGYTPLILDPCLSEHFVFVYIDFIVPKYNFGMNFDTDSLFETFNIKKSSL